MATMKAVVIREPGGPEVLKIEQIPIPKPQTGQVLIRVKAFGLNRSEMFTRQGHSPGVDFPRVLGIEATGVVEDAPGGEFQKGDRVITAMGGLGRQFDGGYAEYTCTYANLVYKVDAPLDWETYGAFPEMLQTAWGSLFKSLKLQKDDRILIRGGTSSVGLAAAALAKNHGAYVYSTSRRADREELLKSNGADEILVDDGDIAKQLESKGIEKVDKVLELIGTKTLRDSLLCTKQGGIVCISGILGNEWMLSSLNPMELIPSSVSLTTYSGQDFEFKTTPLAEMAQQIVDGKLKIKIGKIFHIDDIVEAHKVLDANTAGGKIVVLT